MTPSAVSCLQVGDAIGHYAALAGIELRTACRGSDYAFAQALVRAGVGISLVPSVALTPERDGLAFVALEPPRPTRYIGVAVPRFRIRVLVDEDGTPHEARIELDVALPTVHTIRQGDARDLSWIPDNSIHLIVTSPPYHDLKKYDGGGVAQLGDIADYREFLAQLLQVWEECYRVLVPGGKLFVNVGDVLRSRKQHGRHHILPLPSHIRVQCFDLGFDCINGPIWHKIGNVAYEQDGPGAFLGKPNQPNAKIKLEIEYVLGFVKPGPYRTPTEKQKRLSFIPNDEHQKIFRQIWDDIPGASTKNGHPAPFPVELPRRIIRGYSFVGDVVLDPFAGHGNTMHAAMELGRNSIMNEISRKYVEDMISKAQEVAQRLAAA